MDSDRARSRRYRLALASRSPTERAHVVTSKELDIVFFSWESLGWGEVRCYGGVLRRRAHATNRRPGR
jgi:hypothetical protein